MAERAHPDDPAFKDHWQFRLRRGLIPWVHRVKNPYRLAFAWRYDWVNTVCRGKDVLDVPCGMGWGTSLIKGTRSLQGIDLNAESILEARKRYGSHAEFSVGDMAELKVLDLSLDVVCCLEGIEHVPKEVGRSFLKETQRVLRDGGLLMISSPYCRTQLHSGNPYHIYEYQPEEIQRLLAEFFVIEEIITRNVDIMTVLYIKCKKKNHN